MAVAAEERGELGRIPQEVGASERHGDDRLARGENGGDRRLSFRRDLDRSATGAGADEKGDEDGVRLGRLPGRGGPFAGAGGRVEPDEVDRTGALLQLGLERAVDGDGGPFVVEGEREELSSGEEGKCPAGLADDEVLLNAWAAAELAARPGDTVELAYRVPGAGGALEERKVELGVSNRVQAQVLSGLAEGERVVSGLVVGNGAGRPQMTPRL